MRIALLYETYSSTTESVVMIVKDLWVQKGHEVVVSKLQDRMDFTTESYDLVVLATPSWFDRGREGQPHTAFLTYMDAHAQDNFSQKKFGFIGLGDSNYAHFCLAIDILEDFFVQRGAQKWGETLKLDNFYLNTEGETKKIQDWCNTL